MDYFVGFSDVTPTPPPVQQDQSSEAANQIDQSGATGSNTAQTTSAQRSRTPTPSLDTKPSSVPPSSAIQESNQPSPGVASELNALPLISQTQSATNNSVSQPSKNDSQGKGNKNCKTCKRQFVHVLNGIISFEFCCCFLALTPGPQAVSMVKTQKKQRKEGSNDFDNTSRDRDDVQSPAYSDISDDSTPVAESDMSGKHCMKHSFIITLPLFFRYNKLLEVAMYN